MSLNCFRQYWATLQNTPLWNQRLRIKNHRRVIFDGVVKDFVQNKRVCWDTINDDDWTVVYFGHPAITEADEKIPEYNRPIEIRVI